MWLNRGQSLQPLAFMGRAHVPLPLPLPLQAPWHSSRLGRFRLAACMPCAASQHVQQGQGAVKTPYSLGSGAVWAGQQRKQQQQQQQWQ